MKPGKNATGLYALLLALALFWRMLGAPMNIQDFQNLQTPFRQARMLLPQRAARLLKLWIGVSDAASQPTAAQEDGKHQPENESILVYLTQQNRLVQMPLEEYVRGVAAAEMPAQYHMEALKAQMVAARTRVLWQQAQGGCSQHPGADICTDSSHCQGFATPDECRERWGASYEAYCDRLLEAQRETAGRWIAYEDEPITVLYHAISGGRTENAQTVFASQPPYLVSVESEGEEDVRGYQQETFVSFEEMAEKLNAACDVHTTAGELQQTFGIASYTDSGRVQNVQVGSSLVQATQLRSVLGLRSTWFSITASPEGITFHQRGWGHGVGMSQAGANSMAAQGADYEQILKHYYTGVSIRN